jgi:hypothetical protein
LNKAISAGIGVGIGLIALAIILLTPGEVDTMQDESATPVELSDEVKVASEDSKSYDVVISEGLDVGDGNP